MTGTYQVGNEGRTVKVYGTQTGSINTDYLRSTQRDLEDNPELNCLAGSFADMINSLEKRGSKTVSYGNRGGENGNRI